MNIATSDHGAQASFYVDQSRADTWVVTVIGEVDLADRDRFDAAVERALAAFPTKLVVDLAGARFLDSSVLRVLITAAGGAASLEVRAPSPTLRRLIELSGLAELLPMAE
jgi:anti-anti-sigma factor